MKKRLFFLIFAFGLILISLGSLAFFQLREVPLVSPLPAPSDFSLVVLPDSQNYSQNYPEIFIEQTQWVVDQKESQSIVFASHTGDITNSWNNPEEWQNASQALGLLDGVVPFGLSTGNHDDPKMLSRYFPESRFQGESWYGGYFGKDDANSYQFFFGGGMEFIILHLEFEPSEAVLVWADEILKQYPSRRAIVTSHYILDYDGFRSPIGQEIYEALVDNPNLFLMLCGHIHTEAKRTDWIDGRPVHQLLADYQARANGGNGWLRVLKFLPGEDKIEVLTYSPHLDQYETDENSQFTLEYQME